MTVISKAGLGSGEVLAQLRDMNISSKHAKSAVKTDSSQSFMDHLTNALKEINTEQKGADQAAIDLSTGKNQNIHETMLAATQAELSFNLMVQVRNKVLEAYQEVMRMQV